MELIPLSYVLLQILSVVLYLRLWQVVLGCPALDLSFILQFVGTFPLLRIRRSKVSLFQFKLMLDLDNVSVHRFEQGDVQELHCILDVPM